MLRHGFQLHRSRNFERCDNFLNDMSGKRRGAGVANCEAVYRRFPEDAEKLRKDESGPSSHRDLKLEFLNAEHE